MPAHPKNPDPFTIRWRWEEEGSPIRLNVSLKGIRRLFNSEGQDTFDPETGNPVDFSRRPSGKDSANDHEQTPLPMVPVPYLVARQLAGTLLFSEPQPLFNRLDLIAITEPEEAPAMPVFTPLPEEDPELENPASQAASKTDPSSSEKPLTERERRRPQTPTQETERPEMPVLSGDFRGNFPLIDPEEYLLFLRSAQGNAGADSQPTNTIAVPFTLPGTPAVNEGATPPRSNATFQQVP